MLPPNKLHIKNNRNRKGSRDQSRQPSAQSREKTERKKNLKLSTLVKEHMWEQSGKLSFVQRCITHIDVLPLENGQMLENITKLYLSNNLISSLDNLDQFPNLQTLSLSHNNLAQLPVLRNLCVLPNLTSLALQGNPICKSIIYWPYVCGVTCGRLKILDQEHLVLSHIQESLSIWSVYEDNMRQLIVNYTKLMHTMQLYKKIPLHIAIRTAGQQFDSIQRQQVDFQAYMREVEAGISYLPTSFIINIQSILYRDVQSLCENKNQGNFQPIALAMYRLRNKQQEKLQDLLEQVKHHNHIKKIVNQEVSEVREIMERGLKGEGKEKLYAQWKLLARFFHLLKAHKQKRLYLKWAAEDFSNLIKERISSSYNHFFISIKNYNKIKAINSLIHFCSCLQSQQKKNGFKCIWNEYKKVSTLDLTIEKKQDKKRLKNIFQVWYKETKYLKMQKENKRLKEKIAAQQIKQEKYQNKIKLLEQLLQIMQRNKNEDLPEAKSILASSITTLSHEELFRSPCRKAIRKNGGKQNASSTNFTQRKFNSSRKMLKIDNQS